MRKDKIVAGLLPTFLMLCLSAAAQLSPTQPDPLSRIRESAQGNPQACSASGETLCEQVAPKIIQNAMGDSPIGENLRKLKAANTKNSKTSLAAAGLVSRSVAAFQDSGLDVRTEKYASHDGGAEDTENVVAEIRGREKPDEWVLLGAHLDSRAPDNNCNAAIVIEAARDILRTGILPRRSIRFVLFTGEGKGIPGAWAYMRAHRAEIDRAGAAVIFGAGCGNVTGYLLNGRHDIESGLREAMKPIESLGANHYSLGTLGGFDNLDFLLEGIPTLVADRGQAGPPLPSHAASRALDKIDISELKRDAAIAAVTVFGIAERAAPIGTRQSRAEIESLLKTSDLEQQMKAKGLWRPWESAERGRIP